MELWIRPEMHILTEIYLDYVDHYVDHIVQFSIRISEVMSTVLFLQLRKMKRDYVDNTI